MVYGNVNNRQQNKTIEWDCHLTSIIIRWNALVVKFLTLPLMVSLPFFLSQHNHRMFVLIIRGFCQLCFLGSVQKTILSKANKDKKKKVSVVTDTKPSPLFYIPNSSKAQYASS